MIGASFDRQPDDELEAILGVPKVKINYQNGKKTIKDAYYDVNHKDLFLLKTGCQKVKRIEKIN